jgi:hypothetical protein
MDCNKTIECLVYLNPTVYDIYYTSLNIFGRKNVERYEQCSSLHHWIFVLGA